MKMRSVHFFVLLLTILLQLSQKTVLSQEYRGIKHPGNKYEVRCSKCLEAINSKPPEVQFGIVRDPDNNLFFVVNSNWIKPLFKSGNDGIAVDIITRDQIVCNGKNQIDDSWIKMGTMTHPVYFKDFKNEILADEYNTAYIKLGKVPESLREKEIEFNLILISNGYFCHYQRFYDLQRYKWDLLDMGLYMDSIEYGVQYDTNSAIKALHRYSVSYMKFVVPFEKNKSTYKQEDIQPFYDSLQLRNFNINKIEIRAYASVEGSAERNAELQKKRAESIISVLQENQVTQIEKKISTAENWVEFYADISGTSFASLGNLSKPEIKEKLTNKNTVEKLEPILSRHRKAVILLEVERKSTLTEDRQQLVREFQQALASNNLETAAEIQRSIFAKVINNQLPEDIMQELKIPNQNQYGVLINNEIAFNHFLYPNDVLESYRQFEELDALMPNNRKVKYNLCAMKFRIWILGLEQIDGPAFEKQIKKLKDYGISNNLIKRMLINFHIIMSEHHYINGEYAKKDESLEFIRRNYRFIGMSNQDLLSLSQFFASYAKFDWAIKLLTPEVKSLDANEDLLFYYINLTIADPSMMKRASYKTILLNAISINRGRYCALFNSIERAGASFQLLFDEKLKSIYCQDCEEKL